MAGVHEGTTREDQMAIKVIVELQAKPGRRDDLRRVLESLIATSAPGQDGFLGTRGPASFGSGIPEQAERLWRGPAAIRAHDSRACALRLRRVQDFCDQAKRLR